MDQVIERVGLPVKCRLCDAHGRVLPRTDYGGWQKRKTIFGLKWYCPEHPGAAERLSSPIITTKVVSAKVEDSLDELMDLI